MFVVVVDYEDIEKIAFSFNTIEEAYSYMLKDYKKEIDETFDNHIEIYNKGIDTKHAFIEDETGQYAWDIVEVFDPYDEEYDDGIY